MVADQQGRSETDAPSRSASRSGTSQETESRETTDTLTKSDLVDALDDRIEDSTERECAGYVETLIETIKRAAESGEEVMISTFGKFVVRHKDARVGRNPKTGVEFDIPERKVVRFKVSDVFTDQLNGEREFEGF